MHELVTSGYFNTFGQPCVRIQLTGVFANFEMEALIDTAFAGFLYMPVEKAMPLGLTLSGQLDVLSPEGTINEATLARGCVSIADRRHWGDITLQSHSTETAIGVELLRQFNLALMLTPPEVRLLSTGKSTRARPKLTLINAQSIATRPFDS